MAVIERTEHPSTPDGRYLVVRGRLWRKSNPHLAPGIRRYLVQLLMEVRQAMQGRDQSAQVREGLRAIVDEAKQPLGERGPVWWDDGEPDFNGHLVKNTPYAAWFEALG